MRKNGLAATAALGLLLAGTPVALAASFDVDPVHSTVLFKVNHLGFMDFYGRFDHIAGAFRVEGASGSVEIEIRTDSINTGNEQRDKHLRSPDFLNATQFPVASFKSTKAELKDGVWHVAGDLTLHGVTRPVGLKLTQGRTGDVRGTVKTGFNGELTILRSEFGMDFMLGGIGDEITLMLAVEGSQK